MGKENIRINPKNVEETAEEIELTKKNTERLKVLNEWLDWLEKENGGIPASFLIQKALIGKSSPTKKTDSE